MASCPIPEPDAPFEFASSRGLGSPAALSAADDIFHEGIIWPLGAAPPPPPAKTWGTLHLQAPWSESFDQPLRTRRGSAAKKDQYQRLRSSSERAYVMSSSRNHLCFLGAVKVPGTMDLREIRSRQRARSQAVDVVGSKGAQSPAWRLLWTLSCKGTESAGVVAAPVRLVSHVRGAGRLRTARSFQNFSH